MRTSHTVSGQTTSYTWDVTAGLPVVLQDGTNTYVYGVDLISATDGGGVQTYFLTDGLGSTTDLRDGNGNSVASYSYDVFGAIRTQGGSSSNYWLFTGEQRDATEGLYYLRARYYDPAVGRFLTQDPLAGDAGKPQTQNRYPYVMNDPVNYIDPSGLEHEFGWAFLGIDPPPGFDCAHLESQDERASCYGEYAVELVDYVIEVLAPAWQEFISLASACWGSEPCHTAAVEVGVAGCSALTGGWGAVACGAAGSAILSYESVVDCIGGSTGGCVNAGINMGISVGSGATGGHTIRGLIRPREFVVGTGKNWRFAPFGSTYTRVPHYHRRAFDPLTGKTLPNGSLKWHRPWEKGF